MAEFPTSVPTFTDLNPAQTLAQNNHSARHNKVHTELRAVAEKVGEDGSTDPNSLEKRATDLRTDVDGLRTDVDGLLVDPVTQAYVDAAIAAALSARELPIGSIYVNKTNSANPATYLGYGTWVAVEDQMIMAVGPTYGAGTTGGAATHAHGLASGWAMTVLGSGGIIGQRRRSIPTTFNETHRHTASASSPSTNVNSASELGGNTDSGSSLPPYFTAYVWERTA